MSGRIFAFIAIVFGMMSVAVASNEALHETVKWRMSLDASGRITALDPVGTANPALQAKIEPVVRGWEFVPGAVNGQPADTDTTLSVQVALQPIPDSQQLSVLVEDVRTGGSLGEGSSPPRFPSGVYDKLVREGGFARYFLEISYDNTGAVRNVVAAAGSTEGIERLWRSAEKAAREWKYEPEKVAGIGVPGTIVVPLCFSVGSSQETALRTMARCEWTRPGSKIQIREGQSLALDSSVRLKTDVVGSML